MRTRLHLLVGLSLLLLGCVGILKPGPPASDDSRDGPLPDSVDSVGSGSELPHFEVFWDDDALRVDVEDEDPQARFHFGLAQTSQCAEGCWTGEDCLNGLGSWSYCHPLGPEGIDLVYGADPNTLVEGQQTVFTSADFIYVTTYMVTRDSDGACWVFGTEPSYYASQPCRVE